MSPTLNNDSVDDAIRLMLKVAMDLEAVLAIAILSATMALIAALAG